MNRILEHNSTQAVPLKEVKDFVVLDRFTTQAFSTESRLYLSPLPTDLSGLDWPKSRSMVHRGPRVGLTLKRFDEHKTRFWMSDYRFVVYPERHRKMQALVILGMLGAGRSVEEVVSICKCKKATVEELAGYVEEGRKNEKKKVADFAGVSGEMKNKDYGLVYGVHLRLH